MASKQDYIAGLITLTNGSPNFTGTGTGWAAASVGIGDTIFDLPGTPYQGVINTITNDFAGTLTRNWDGPDLAGVPYRIRFQPDGSRYPAAVVQLIEELENGNLQAFAQLLGFANGIPVFTGPGALEVQSKSSFVSGADYDVQVNTMAARAAYDGQATGFAVLVADVGTAFGPENDGRSAIFSKNSNTSGDWSDPAYVTGGIGLTPDVDATVAMLPPGSAPTVVPTPIPGGTRLDFSLPEASGFNPSGTYNIANAYDQDDVVLHNRSSFIAIQAVPAGQSPSSVYPPVDTTYWQVLVMGGANGTGTGDVVGPAVAVNRRLAVFGDTTGKLIAEASGLTAAQQGQARVDLGAGVLVGLRNKLLNGNFDVGTRNGYNGVTPVSATLAAGANSYISDRWILYNLTNQPLTWEITKARPYDVDGSRVAINFLAAPTTGSVLLQHKVEGVDTLTNKLATTSIRFLDAGIVAGTTVRSALFQEFGTGGSPSTVVTIPEKSYVAPVGASVFKATHSIPSILGKTLGTNRNNSLTLNTYFEPRSIGYFVITNFALVEGDATAEADPFPMRPLALESAMCERYFRLVQTGVLDNSGGAGSLYGNSVQFNPPMRAIPTVNANSVLQNVNATSYSRDFISANGYRTYLTATSTGFASVYTIDSADAEI